MVEALGLAASLVGIVDAAQSSAEALGGFLRTSNDANEDLVQIADNMRLLNRFLHETTNIFLNTDNQIPQSATEAFGICQRREAVLHAAIDKRMVRHGDSKSRRILMPIKYSTKQVKKAFQSYKESVGILRDIAAMSMTQSVIQQQSRLEIETLTLRETTEGILTYMQNYNFQRAKSAEGSKDADEAALTRSHQPVDGVVILASAAQAGRIPTTQYHTDDHTDQHYQEYSRNERKFSLETQRLAAFQPDDTIFNAYLVPTKLDHQERVIVYTRCKLDTGSDVNLIDDDIIYKHNFEHLISEIPEPDRTPLKGFNETIWTPTHHISVEFYLPGAMKKRVGLFFLCPDVDFDILICKSYFREIQEGYMAKQKSVRMLTAPAPLTPEQIEAQEKQQEEQKKRNKALKKIQDQHNAAERARKRLQPPASPAFAAGGRVWTIDENIAANRAILPPPIAGSSRQSRASVESRVVSGPVPAIPPPPSVMENDTDADA